MSLMMKFFLTGVLVFVILIVIIAINTLRFTSKQMVAQSIEEAQ